MRFEQTKIDTANIRWANYASLDQKRLIIEAGIKLASDPEKKERKKNSLCPICHYWKNSRIGGAAITFKPCGICEKEMCFSSTCTDKICPECALENQLCKQCGADIDLINRKNERPFETKKD